jgi:hypothetical protein
MKSGTTAREREDNSYKQLVLSPPRVISAARTAEQSSNQEHSRLKGSVGKQVPFASLPSSLARITISLQGSFL